MSDKVKTLQDFVDEVREEEPFKYQIFSTGWVRGVYAEAAERYAAHREQIELKRGFDRGVEEMASQVNEKGRTKLACWDSTCTGCGDSIDDCCLPTHVIDEDHIAKLAQAAKQSFKP